MAWVARKDAGIDAPGMLGYHEKRGWLMKRFPNIKHVATAAGAAVVLALGGLAIAGSVKTGGTYYLSGDQFTTAGSKNSGGAYELLFSAGQPVGHDDMTGGTYAIEGGFVSGVVPVFQAAKSLSLSEAPAGYAGPGTDKVPGTRLTYTVDFTNLGEGANNVLIEDALPAGMTFLPATIELTVDNTTTAMTDGLDGDECAYMAATSSVHCLISGVAAGATGAVVFKTTID